MSSHAARAAWFARRRKLHQHQNNDNMNNSLPYKDKRIVNPYLGDTTCEGAEKSSLFWLGDIRKSFYHLKKAKKWNYLHNMISQAHGCIHKDYHKNIITALRENDVCQRSPNMVSQILKLEQEFCKMNMEFLCTCGNKSKTSEIPELTDTTLQNKVIHESHKNDQLMSCELAEDTSLFWLGKIRDEFHDLSTKKKKKFLKDIMSQAHGCLHNNYHGSIIEALRSGLGDQQKYVNNAISKLENVYYNMNLKFICTCGSGLSESTLHTKTSQESCEILDSHEINKKDEIGTDLTYEDLLDIFELHD